MLSCRSPRRTACFSVKILPEAARSRPVQLGPGGSFTPSIHFTGTQAHPGSEPSPPLLSAWKDGCSGGGETLRPGALPELRGGLLVPGAVRSDAGPARDDFPADGAVSAGHDDR